MAELLTFFPKVYAQSTTAEDALAQPTFGNINIGESGTQTSSILLTSNATAVTVGQRFKVTVSIKTNDVAISEYKAVISFDPTKLQVIDQDASVAGNQIKNLDTIFVAKNTSTDNTVSANGTITFIGKTTDGNPLSINRDVLEIEFQAQTASTTPVKVVTGASGSQLVSSSGSSLTYTANEVNIQITASATGESGNENPPEVTPTPPVTGEGTTPPPTTLPDTALEAGVSDIIVVALSLLIIAIGAKMSIRKKSQHK
jgi:hypothetical protein